MEPEVSVVVPVYRNAETLSQLVVEIEHALAPLARPFELLFVVDACPQNSAAILSQLGRERRHLRWVVLQRNWGQNWAVLVGLCWARGARLVVMDADLQDPPAAIPLLLSELGPGAAVVFAGRRGHYESAFRLLTSRAFKLSLWILSGSRLPMNAGLFLAMTRSVADQVLECCQPDPYLLGLLAQTRAQLSSIAVSRAPRPRGTSAYNTRMRIATALNGWRCLWPVHAQCAFGGATSRPTFRQRIQSMDAILFQGGETSS